MLSTLNLTAPPGPLLGKLGADRIRNHSDRGKNGHDLKSALDYLPGARTSGLAGKMPEHTNPLLFSESSSFVLRGIRV